jgi:type II secretory pathway pseudopilin PulG
MIELVFVIVIIGILAAVAIPKLAANRDDAAAKVCENEAAGLLQELTGYYAKNGYFDTVDNMSSLPVGVSGAGNNGIKEASGTIPSTAQAVTYVCNGEDIVTYTPTQSTYTDAKGKVHDQFGIVTADPGGQATVQAKIAATDFSNSNFYKASPGYVIGGN